MREQMLSDLSAQHVGTPPIWSGAAHHRPKQRVVALPDKCIDAIYSAASVFDDEISNV